MNLKGKILNALRVAWALAALAALSHFSTHFADATFTIKALASIALWVPWLAGLVALGIPSNVSLTTLRITAPLLGAAWLSVVATPNSAIVATVIALAINIAIFSAPVGSAMVNGSAYGSETRYLLKPPTVTAASLIVLGSICMAVYASLIHFMPSGSWLLFALAGFVVISVAAISRLSHTLSTRWLVFVPAGVVVHDPMSLDHAVLFRRKLIRYFTTSQTTTINHETVDLSGGTVGLTSSIEIDDDVQLDLRDKAAITANNVRFAPSTPGAVLKEARIRGIKTQL